MLKPLALGKALSKCETMQIPAGRQELVTSLKDEGISVTWSDSPKLLAMNIIRACLNVEPNKLDKLLEVLEFLENEQAQAWLEFYEQCNAVAQMGNTRHASLGPQSTRLTFDRDLLRMFDLEHQRLALKNLIENPEYAFLPYIISGDRYVLSEYVIPLL